MASVAYGLCQLAQPGHDLKSGAVVVMAVVHVAVNNLARVVVQAAMQEKQPELFLVKHIDYVQAAQAAAHKHQAQLRDSLVQYAIPEQAHIQSHCALVAVRAAKAAVLQLLEVIITVPRLFVVAFVVTILDCVG